MKKLLFIPALSIFFSAQAQTPQNKSIPIVQKATATWCGPCGQWGWTLQEDITTDNSAKAAVFACYGSSSSLFYNQAADDLTSWGQSWPNWAVNNINRTAFSSSGGIYTTTTQNTIKNAVDSFAATAPVASTGYKYSISGNTITINTVTKFWKPGNGEYYLSAYMIEDGVMGIQNGQTGTVAHHNVLRGSVTSSTYGDMIASGSIAMNQTYNKNFTFTITDNTWVKANVKVIVVLWKKNGSDYDFVNANNAADALSAVANVEAINDLNISPNPASDKIFVSGTVATTSKLNISLVNTLGQIVYSNTLEYGQTNVHETINLDGVSGGIYQLTIRDGAQGISTRKIVVTR